MSTAPDSATPPTPAGAVPVYNVPAPGTPKKKRLDHLVVYGHSNLFYWWPVWAAAFVMAAWSYFDGQQMAVVPPQSVVVYEAEVEGFPEPRTALVAPPGKEFPLAPGTETERNGKPKAPASMTVARGNGLGVIFALVLLLTVVVSTLTFRGLVSVIVVAVLVAVVFALALLGYWDDIFRFFGGMDIRMNAAGYLFIAVPLFVIWCVVTFWYDRQHYIVFDEGQIRYVREVGESEMVVPSGGAIVEKKRDDVFRHWLFGFGSGDLQIRVGGQNGQAIELENVLFIGGKRQLINDFLQKKEIVVS
jgi:hypothetical protein